MKKAIFVLLLLIFTAMPVRAADITVPTVPDSAQELMPAETESFGEGLWYVFKSALQAIRPDIAAACRVCCAVIGAVMLVSLLGNFPGKTKTVAELAGTVAVACLLLSDVNSLMSAAVDTITELSNYGKLLLPVMTTVLAAQGGVSGSAALYTGTAVFDALLGALIPGVLVPMVYVFLALSTANGALEEDLIKKLRDFAKWLVTWCLKILLYVFTGYMAITGVISGTTDQAALKAAKLTISGMVPVVGGILSDASESILIGAGVVKNAAGVYGMLAVLSIAIGPFLRIGVHYLLLKITAAICAVFAGKRTTELVQDFSGAMGLLLAMTGTMCLLLLVSAVCFLKGVG